MGTRIMITAGLLLLAQPVLAEWSSTVTLTTDYDFRGISQTEGDPALQAGLDFSQGNFYAGLWGSNVDFGPDVDGDLEVDLIAGFSGETEGGWRWDTGATYYVYPGSNDDPAGVLSELPDYAEVYAGGGFGPVDAKLWYSPDYLDSNEDGWYLEANLEVPLPYEVGFFVHAGYSWGNFYDDFENALADPASADFDPAYGGDDLDYADFAVGLTRTFGRFDAELKMVTTDTDSYFEIDSGAARNDSRVILSVSTTFPWSDEE